ncbi:MAG: putative dsRNA-binding protein [Polyangiaceae bacterium]
MQAQGFAAPIYRVVETRGPPHDPVFVVAVMLSDRVLGEGEGRSKRLAERAAAAAALLSAEQREGV